jgi:PmbA protein
MVKQNNEIAKLQQIVEDVLLLAKNKGATSAEVGASLEDGYAVNVRMGDLETIEYHREQNFGITVYFGQQKGTATTSDTTEESLAQAVTAACNIAKFTEVDICAGLADKNLLAKQYVDLNLFHPWDLLPADAIEMALTCENYARGLDRRITNSEGVELSTYKSAGVYGNSHGFCGYDIKTMHGMNCHLIASSEECMERDGDYTVARDAKDLLAYQQLAKLAVSNTVARLKAQKLSTRKVPVILHAKVARSLLGCFLSAINGSALYRGTSFLLDHLGKKIFPDFVQIYERPHIAKGLASAYFDAEGVATGDKDFITQGVLTNYMLDSYSARKLKMTSTANAGGAHNLFITASDLDFTQLLAQMDTGLLVTELIGQGVNLTTGDYSKGAVGFWVERGVIQYPVAEITISANLKDMFANLVAIANDFDRRSSLQTGSMLLAEMTVAGS